jgi:hypothetical protein
MGSAQSIGSGIGRVDAQIDNAQRNDPKVIRKYTFWILSILVVIFSSLSVISEYNTNSKLDNSPEKKNAPYFIAKFILYNAVGVFIAWLIGWFTELSLSQRLAMVDSICEKNGLKKGTTEYNACVLEQQRFLEARDRDRRIENKIDNLSFNN